VVLFLFAAYRSLGGAAPKATDSSALLSSLHKQLLTSLTSLRAALAIPEEASEGSDAATDGRKLSAAVQQSLDRLPAPAELDNRDETARSLLAVAAEDTAWAWRMLQARALSPAVSAAAAALADHAAACCEQAGPLLAALSLREPVDGP
jgi:hypothetical protein